MSVDEVGSVLWDERMVKKMLAKMKEQEPSISLEGASGSETRRQAAEGEKC